MSKKYALKHPIKIDGGATEIAEITLRRLKGKDLKGMENQPKGLEQTFWLISQLAGISPDAPEEMDGEDIDAISRLIEGFLGRRR